MTVDLPVERPSPAGNFTPPSARVDSSNRPLEQPLWPATPLRDLHLALGATLNAAASSVREYALGARQEHLAVRTQVGLQDQSWRFHLEVVGSRALEVLNNAVANDVTKLGDGEMLYAQVLTDEGRIHDDVTILRCNGERFVVQPSFVDRTRERLDLLAGLAGVVVRDVSREVSALALQGPRALDVLLPLAEGLDVRSVARFSSAIARIGGCACTIARLGCTGEDGFEIYVDRARARYVWEALRESGAAFGLVLFGVNAMHSLRIEKGLLSFHEFMNATPLECGLGPFIAFDKAQFVGKRAVVREKTTGSKRKLTGLRIAGSLSVPWGAPIALNDNEIGEVTSCFFGYTVGQNLGLGFVETEYAVPNLAVTINVNGTPVPAHLSSRRFYDPTNARQRMW